jgi:hypothetical protein
MIRRFKMLEREVEPFYLLEEEQRKIDQMPTGHTVRIFPFLVRAAKGAVVVRPVKGITGVLLSRRNPFPTLMALLDAAKEGGVK